MSTITYRQLSDGKHHGYVEDCKLDYETLSVKLLLKRNIGHSSDLRKVTVPFDPVWMHNIPDVGTKVCYITVSSTFKPWEI